jgi:hypothetical protein
MAAAAGNGGNGEVELRLPALGAFRMAGRDLMLAAVLIALGAGAVSVQFLTLRAWQSAIRGDVAQALLAHERGAREREQILGLLRLEVCTNAYLSASRAAVPETLRPQLDPIWTRACLGAPPDKEPAR